MKTFFVEIITLLSRKSRNRNKFADEQISAHTYTAKNYTTIAGLHNNFILFQYALISGRSHICRSLFLVILGRRKKGLRNADLFGKVLFKAKSCFCCNNH